VTAVEVVRRVVVALEKNAIPYMTVGSFSSNVYGKPRSTKDADFVLELGDVNPSKLVSDIGPDFTLEQQMSFETVTSTTRYRVHHSASRFLVEFFLLSDDPHDRERFARRVSGDIGGQRTFVPTPEDVIITKLRWSKQGQRANDVDDVRGVLEVQRGKLDLPYLRRWTDQHGTWPILDKMLAETGNLKT
jgi:hypothetical protein